MERGLCVVITGPTASGKTTVANRMAEIFPGSARFVTSTSRAPREGEVHGVDYHFLTREEFERGIERDEFLEWEENYGNYYGGSRVVLEEMLFRYPLVIVVVDVRGAVSYRDKVAKVMVMAITVPIEQIRGRIERRAKMDTEELERRMEAVKEELAACEDFDALIPNPDGELEVTIEQVREFIQSQLK
jgi:guanylate kinase